MALVHAGRLLRDGRSCHPVAEAWARQQPQRRSELEQARCASCDGTVASGVNSRQRKFNVVMLYL